MKKIQVSYLGLNSLFGRVTTNLLKQSPCIEKLSIYDDDDGSLLDGETNVFIGRDQLSDAVKDVNIVVIGDETFSTQEEDRLKVIGPKIIRYTEAILTSSPNAIIVVAASPLNILVPLVGHFLGPNWKNRLLGITSVDTLRASRILNGLLNNPREAHILPVVGGSSASSRVPLFSHIHPKTVICDDIREKIIEKMKLFDNSKYREMDSVERAYSAVRFIHSVISGMMKDSPIPEIAMTKTTEVPNAEFFSLPMLLGKNGIENAMQLPKFDEVEEKLILEATERLAEDSRKARDYINGLAQESVRNLDTNRDNAVRKSLTWSEPSESSNNSKPVGDEVVDAKRKSPGTDETASIQNRSLVSKSREGTSGDNSPALPMISSAREARPLTFRSLAKSYGSEEARENQKLNRKSIPLSPVYQLLPEPRRTNHDSLKVADVGKSKVDSSRSIKDIETTAEKTTISSAEDVSSRGDARQSPTRTALETSFRIGTLKDDVPQPSSIQNIVPEVIQLGSSSKIDSLPEKPDRAERRPSLTDSEISIPDSDFTETLIKEVNDHLGDIRKNSSTSPCPSSEDNMGTNHWRDCKSLTIEDHGSDNKLSLSNESTEPVVSPHKDEISPNNSPNRANPEVNIHVVSPRKIESKATSSHVSDEQNLSKNKFVPNYESTSQYFNRIKLTKKCDVGIEVVMNSNISNEEKNYNRETKRECDLDIYNQKTNLQNEVAPRASSFKNRKRDIENVLNENFKLEKQVLNLDSEETVRKRWMDKLSEKTKWRSSDEGNAFNPKRSVISNDAPELITDRYPIGFPGIRRLEKPGDADTVTSEGRILRLIDERLSNSSKKISANDFAADVPPKKPERVKREPLSLRSTFYPEGGISKSDKLLRSKLKSNSSSASSVLPGVSFNRRIVKDSKWSMDEDDCVSANLLAAKGRDLESSALVMDMKKELHESGQCHSSQSETPLKLLNLPGCKHRYETSLKIMKFDEKQNEALMDKDINGDVNLGKTRTDLTSDQTKSYFMGQKRGTTHLEEAKKLRPRKRSRKQKETSKPKRKSLKRSSSQAAPESKKDHMKPRGKSPSKSLSGTFKRAEQHPVSKANKDLSTPMKNEPAERDNEWESKYFTKASEMFFRMFRESVTSNKMSINRGNARKGDQTVDKDGNEVTCTFPGTSGIQPVLSNNNDPPSRKLATKWTLPPKMPIKSHSTRELMKLDAENNSKSETTNDDALKAFDENGKRNRKITNELKLAKTTEGLNVNKSSLPGRNIRGQSPPDEKGITENVFKTKVTGMEKYQIEKNDHMKKEFKMNTSTDVEKLFEESSTIPFHISSDGKTWTALSTPDKGNKFSRVQSTLQGITATSDKGKGDAVNMIDFNICKSPSMNDQGTTKCDVGKTRVNNLLQQSAKHTSSVDYGKGWKPSIATVPITSKTIKQVNPQNYREQILNSYGRKTDEAPKGEKSNKWERIFTVFKQIIIRDLEDKRPNYVGTSESPNSLSKPAVMLGSTTSKAHAPLRSTAGGNPVPNQKSKKGKITSNVKKKKETLKKKQPAESMKRSLVIKNNPKKIVNYFSKRGISSSNENPSATNFAIIARTQLLTSLKEIKLSDTKHAPPPIFWSGVAGLVPIVLPPLSFLIFGYSHSLATVQMTFAATISAFLSGTKYGTHVAHVDSAQWSNVVASILPQFVSFTGLLLPQMIGFPLIMASIALNGFIDLTSGNYAPWYKALRLALTVPVLASLLLTCIFKIFH
ncbi:hypothetical protein GE061_017969 [Apolygus lucorum]|uniref:malate dehydrogenase n=1 Tax=Apolygus lucorum TaxID=248454 RepID=A0A8S9XCM7_APOLU|nr:hypothetical protein GE061_017969 [Apolygus lucorum]